MLTSGNLARSHAFVNAVLMDPTDRLKWYDAIGADNKIDTVSAFSECLEVIGASPADAKAVCSLIQRMRQCVLR